MAQPADQYFSKTLEKGLRVLSLFNEHRPAYSQSEIARILGINTTSTFRFTNTLVQLGYLKKDPATRKLRLGIRSLVLGATFIRTIDIHRVIRSLVDEVHEKHNITVDVAMGADDALMIVHRREADGTLTYRLPSVSRAWHATSLGKVFLAYLPGTDREAMIDSLDFEPRTPRTIVNRERLMEDLEGARRLGYAVANEEFLPGLITIGAPILNLNTGLAVGAVSFDFSTIQTTVEKMIDQYADLVTDLGQSLSRMVTGL